MRTYARSEETQARYKPQKQTSSVAHVLAIGKVQKEKTGLVTVTHGNRSNAYREIGNQKIEQNRSRDDFEDIHKLMKRWT